MDGTLLNSLYLVYKCIFIWGIDAVVGSPQTVSHVIQETSFSSATRTCM